MVLVDMVPSLGQAANGLLAEIVTARSVIEPTCSCEVVRAAKGRARPTIWRGEAPPVLTAPLSFDRPRIRVAP